MPSAESRKSNKRLHCLDIECAITWVRKHVAQVGFCLNSRANDPMSFHVNCTPWGVPLQMNNSHVMRRKSLSACRKALGLWSLSPATYNRYRSLEKSSSYYNLLEWSIIFIVLGKGRSCNANATIHSHGPPLQKNQTHTNVTGSFLYYFPANPENVNKACVHRDCSH